MSDTRCSRRRFLMQAALAAGAAPMLGLAARDAHAALAKLPVTNAQAKALSYTEDAKTVKHPLYKAASTCSNCQLFTAGTNACAIFPGFAVAPAGWCSAWAKKA